MPDTVPRPPIYLDHAATTPLDRRVREAMDPWLGAASANPSTRYGPGVEAREAMDRARSRVARTLGAQPSSVTFTGGGTEANNLAVLGLARASARRGRHVLLGPVEHACVRGAAEALSQEGCDVEVLAGDDQGAVLIADLEARLRPDTVLVAQMLVSNELGTRQPVTDVARVLRRTNSSAYLHVDAVQAFGKVEIDFTELGASTLAVAAHKIHGPQGVGALLCAAGVRPRPLVFGGGQEGGLRAGTENVAGCVGFGRAAQLAEQEAEGSRAHLSELRERLEAGLAALPGIRFLLRRDRTVPGILTLLVPGPPAEVWQHHLELHGVYVGLGSACQSRTGTLSPTWSSLGLAPDAARQVVRLSMSSSTTREEIDAALRALAAVAAHLEATPAP